MFYCQVLAARDVLTPGRLFSHHFEKNCCANKIFLNEDLVSSFSWYFEKHKVYPLAFFFFFFGSFFNDMLNLMSPDWRIPYCLDYFHI